MVENLFQLTGLLLTMVSWRGIIIDTAAQFPEFDDYCNWKRLTYPRTFDHLHNWSQLDPVELVIGTFLPSVLPALENHGSLLGGFNETLRPVIDMALRDIQMHPCILKGYKLLVDVKDTECKASHGTKAFFDMMNKSPKMVALFGDACTAVNEPIAMMAKYWKIIQVSYAETHPKFSGAGNVKSYNTFYRVVPGDRNLHSARYRFLTSFNWTHVGTIKQSDEPRYALEKDIRIIIGDFNTKFARKVFCEAYKQKLYGPSYVWLIPGYHNDTWWKSQNQPTAKKADFQQTAVNTTAVTVSLSCNSTEFQKALEGHFIMEFVKEREDANVVGLNRKTVLQYYISYIQACKRNPLCNINNRNIWHAYVYDGLWTLAVALGIIHKLHQVVAEYSELKRQRYYPGNPKNNQTWFQNTFLNALNRTSFEGMTGKIRFDTHDRLGRIRIAQFQNGSYVSIGEYDGAEDSFDLDFHAFNGWTPPRDAKLVLRKRQYINAALYLVMCILSSVGLVLAVVFLTANIRFRKHKFIKMSSPNMNNLIIIGSMLTYCSVIILGLDTRFVSERGFTTLCYAKVWVLCLGFTMAFGSMFSKTWRVHSIFTNIKIGKKAIKDYKLFLIVGVLLLLDAIILGCWAIVAPWSTEIFPLHNEVKTAANDVVILPTIELCQCSAAIVFQAILYGYKGLLMVLGCFLAWETRHVNVPALNDSKYIGMAVYNVVLMCVLGVSLSFILATRKNESYCLTSLFIIFCTTLTLCLVFLPKVVELIRNPKGNERKYRPGIMHKSGMIGMGKKDLDRQGSLDQLQDEKDRLVRLEQDNQVWHKHLDEKTSELAEVVALLRECGEDVHSGVSVKDSAFESSPTPSTLAAFYDPFGGVYVGPGDDDQEPIRSKKSITKVIHSPDVPTLCRPTVLSPKLEDATEETSLLPKNKSGAHRSQKGHQQIFKKLRSSLRTRGASVDIDDMHRRQLCFMPQSVSLDDATTTKATESTALDPTSSADHGAAYYSMPDLGSPPPVQKSSLDNLLLSYTEPQDMTSCSGVVKTSSTVTPTSDSRDGDETSSDWFTAPECFDPIATPGGSKMRYIDSILSEDLLFGNSKTLHSISENTAAEQGLHSESDSEEEKATLV